MSMTISSRTFSESWHRVADLRVRPRPAVTIHKQLFRGETWYILQDPFNNRFFRIRPEAREFIARLDGRRTAAEVWEECLTRNPDGAPGQEDVIQLLAQLYHAGLISSDLPVDSRKLFERHHRRKQREIRSKLFSPMFFRIPLFDPAPLLRRFPFLIRWFTGRIAFCIWLLALAWAGMTLFDSIPMLIAESKSLLDFSNLFPLYFGLVLVKILHESGHTLVCRRFGGEVHAVGVMLIIFAPLPYMDATSSWGFRSRLERILVAASGMIFELFAASAAALVWAESGPGLLHALAFNMMITASVSTLLFNANPLLRFDGYYILSDLLDIPNLHARSLNQLRHMAESSLFGVKQSASPADTPGEAFWLAVYGFLVFFYRIIVYSGIILFVSDRFLLAGLLMTVFCVFAWGIMPSAHFFNYLITAPVLSKTRPRAIMVSALSLGIVLFVFAGIPVRNSFTAPGIIESKNYLRVINDAPGQLTEILAENGAKVEKGAPLLRLVNPELDIDIRRILAGKKEVEAMLKQSAVLEGNRAREVLLKRLTALDEKRRAIESKQLALVIRAQQSGIWTAPDIHESEGAWLPRGTELGKRISLENFRFSAVVSQAEAGHLFDERNFGRITVRLNGRADADLPVTGYKVIPFQHERLPSAALGWGAGGDIPVSGKDGKGVIAVEPFFRIYADIEVDIGADIGPKIGTDTAPSPEPVIRHGHSGKIRFALPPEPLLSRMIRGVMQFFQKRYRT